TPDVAPPTLLGLKAMEPSPAAAAPLAPEHRDDKCSTRLLAPLTRSGVPSGAAPSTVLPGHAGTAHAPDFRVGIQAPSVSAECSQAPSASAGIRHPAARTHRLFVRRRWLLASGAAMVLVAFVVLLWPRPHQPEDEGPTTDDDSKEGHYVWQVPELA